MTTNLIQHLAQCLKSLNGIIVAEFIHHCETIIAIVVILGQFSFLVRH